MSSEFFVEAVAYQQVAIEQMERRAFNVQAMHPIKDSRPRSLRASPRRCCSSVPAELRQARWKAIDFEKAVWIVSAATMKMKRPHRVPLARQAIPIPARTARPGRAKRVHLLSRGFVSQVHEQQYFDCRPRRLDCSKEQVGVSGFLATASTLLN